MRAARMFERNGRDPEVRRPEWAVLVPAALGTMLAPLNSTMIAVALPALLGDFDRPLAWGTWIITAYLVAMAAVQPLGGSLGDRYGHRKLFVIGLMLFLVATLVAAFAWNIGVLIVARTVQAIGGAVAIPNGTALTRSLVAPERQGRAFGSIGASVALAAGLGPPIGGVIAEAFGWRWIFAANTALLFPALSMALRLPPDRPLRRAGRFDLLGATLLTCGLVALVLALTVWRLPSVSLAVSPVLAVLALAAGTALARHLRRVPHPLLNVALLQRRGFMPATLTVLLTNLTMYTLLLSLPVFLAARATWGSAGVGLLLAGLSLPMIVLSPLSGYCMDRWGARWPAVLGASLTAIGVLPLLGISPTWSWYAYLSPLVLVGVGLGLSSAPVQATAIQTVPSHQAGQAAGFFSTMRYLGSILGSSVMAALLSGTGLPAESFRVLNAVLLVSACGAIGFAWALPARLTRTDATESDASISADLVRR